ncbi:helicase-related protein [Sphingomonas sp. MMS24-JH45]
MLLRETDIDRALVFTRTKHGADRVVKLLAGNGIASNAIHGNKSQPQRERALAAFKDGTVPILVATDIAARGIDVSGVSHVFNFELPNVPEQYVRIGRTARAGASGEAIALVADDERAYLRDIEKLTRQKVPLPRPARGLPEAGRGDQGRARQGDQHDPRRASSASAAPPAPRRATPRVPATARVSTTRTAPPPRAAVLVRPAARRGAGQPGRQPRRRREHRRSRLQQRQRPPPRWSRSRRFARRKRLNHASLLRGQGPVPRFRRRPPGTRASRACVGRLPCACGHRPPAAQQRRTLACSEPFPWLTPKDTRHGHRHHPRRRQIARVLAGQRISANAGGEGNPPPTASRRQRDHRDDAIAVLHTLRAPSEAMAAAGDAAVWERMILAAIEEAKPGIVM